MKKFFNLLFSRMVMTALLVVIQILYFIVQLLILKSYSVYINIGLTILSIVVGAYIISRDMNPSIKLAWIVPIMMFPLFGGLLYILYGHVVIPRKLKKNLLRIKEQEVYEDLYGGDSNSAEILVDDPPYRLMKYTEKYSKAPVYKGGVEKYYSMGDKVFPDLIHDLEHAKKYIFLEFFIINHGKVWDDILEVLVKKVAEGVEVRVIYDDVGSVFYVNKNYWKELEKMGIKCICFNQIFPFMATILNNRDHRKIAVIDGNIAYTGGFNLSDEYANITHPFGTWKDSGIRMEGGAAFRFTIMFLQMWNTSRFTEASYKRFIPEIKEHPHIGYLQPYYSNPLSVEHAGESIYLQMINDARKYIYVFTPYFITGSELMMAIKLAAKRGIDVRIVTPGIPDKKFIYRMTQSSYKELVEAGVRIYQYTPGFIHSKVILCDDSLASVGSINMDNRSFYHHFECGVLIYMSKVIADIKRDFLQTFEECDEIDVSWCNRRRSRMLVDAVLKLLSPLL